MKQALLDNWAIEEIAGEGENFFLNPSVKIQVLVSALVLWDEVCYLDNGYSSWWNHVADNCKELEILKMLKPIKQIEETPLIDKAKIDYFKLYKNNYREIVARGALEYLYISDKNDMSYIPFDKRANFIIENDLFKKTHQYFTRMDLIDVIDEEIMRYYEELNDYIKKTNFFIDTSCIFNVVKKNAHSISEIYDVIMSLKKEKMVINFKKWVEKMEQEIHKPQNMDKSPYIIKEYIEELREISESQKKKFDIGISSNFPFVGIGINIPISVAKNTKSNLVFPTFLYNEAIGRNICI